jgi:hypothetical protein
MQACIRIIARPRPRYWCTPRPSTGNERDKLHTVIKQRFRIAPFEFRAHSAS